MVCRTLPPGHPCSVDAGSTFAEDTIAVFDALDIDRSGSLDCTLRHAGISACCHAFHALPRVAMHLSMLACISAR